MTRAVFLDRDGVINRNVFNPTTAEWESPHHPDQFQLHLGVLSALSHLREHGFKLFLVSNQPSYAKGKTSLEHILAIAKQCSGSFLSAGVDFAEEYYCLHHPNGVTPGYAVRCECRKPSPYFLYQAAGKHGISLPQSWMIGDRETDIQCGRSARARTVQIAPDHSQDAAPLMVGDYYANNLVGAVEIILKQGEWGVAIT
jgi:D-glycero-D-manno-heptose 1,7-bisphosphate phosphatase